MWDKLRKQVDVDRRMLRRSLTDHEVLLRKCAVAPPDRVELSALGALLHGFYTGIENLFKRVTVELGQEMPQGEGWHKRLLVEMTRITPARPALISASLARTLTEYLQFRHFFRSAYAFQLRWERMAHLVQDCTDVLATLEAEIDTFLETTSGNE